MKKTAMKYGVAATLVLVLLMATIIAVADEINVLNGSQRQDVFTFELACLDDRYSPIADLSLSPSAWQVSVEGFEPLSITGVRLSESTGIHYIVIAQSSVNMDKNPRKDMADAVQSLIDSMGVSDRMTLYRIDSSIKALTKFTADRAQLSIAAGQLSNAGQQSSQVLYTALETALRFGMEKASNVAKTALIVLSDGYNSGKGVATSTEEVTHLVGRSGIRIFTVLLQTSSTSDASFLQAISEQSDGFLLRQKETDAKAAVAKIRTAIQQTVLITVEDQSGAYSALTDDSWRILYTQDNAITLRAGFTMPITPWLAAALSESNTAVALPETPTQDQLAIKPTAENLSETSQSNSGDSAIGDTTSTADTALDTTEELAIPSPAVIETFPLPTETTQAEIVAEVAGVPKNKPVTIIVGISVIALLYVALLMLRARRQKEKEKRPTGHEALRDAQNHIPENSPMLDLCGHGSEPKPTGDVAKVMPMAQQMQQQTASNAPIPVQPATLATASQAVPRLNSSPIRPQSERLQKTFAESPTGFASYHKVYENPSNAPLNQTVAEFSVSSPLDQTVAEIPYSSSLDKTIAEMPSPSPLDRTIAEILQPSPIDATIDEKAFVITQNTATVDRSVHSPSAPVSRLDRTLEGGPEIDKTQEQTYIVPAYQQTTLLLTVRESGGERTLQVPLDMGRAVWFGRDGDILLNPNDQSISRRHFSITLTPSELRLKDNSPNGTKVDSLWIYREERTVVVGNVITIGGEDQKPCEPTEIVITDIRVPGDRKAPNPQR